MQRTFSNRLILQIGKYKNVLDKRKVLADSARALATVREIFPNNSEFPTRHIGPRKTDVVTMLDTLGFKVIWWILFNHFLPIKHFFIAEINLFIFYFYCVLEFGRID